MYWLVGLQNTLDKFLLFLSVVILDTIVAGSYTIAIGSVVPDEKVANILCPIGLTLFLLFGGFFVSSTSIPAYWVRTDEVNLLFYNLKSLNILIRENLILNPNPSPTLTKPQP